MASKKQALLLVGSAKRPHSTSESLGSYLLKGLKKHGFETESMFVHRALKSDENKKRLLEAINRADLVIIAFPLYVDSLPYLLIRALELIAEHRRRKNREKIQRLMVIVNCGFPEAQHNNTALAICRQFARETGFEWAGGLSLGGGEAIHGQALSEVEGMARNVIKSLDLSVTALAEGKSVPLEAIEIMAKPLIPGWMYAFIGGLGWKNQAKKLGTKKKLRDQPYKLPQEKN